MVLAAVLTASVLLGRRGVLVRIIGHVAARIEDLTISHTGGTVNIPSLPIGVTREFYCSPAGESHLLIAFNESGGAKHMKKVDCYFERNYGGSITIHIFPNGKVSWTDSICLPGS